MDVKKRARACFKIIGWNGLFLCIVSLGISSCCVLFFLWLLWLSRCLGCLPCSDNKWGRRRVLLWFAAPLMGRFWTVRFLQVWSIGKVGEVEARTDLLNMHLKIKWNMKKLFALDLSMRSTACNYERARLCPMTSSIWRLSFSNNTDHRGS